MLLGQQLKTPKPLNRCNCWKKLYFVVGQVKQMMPIFSCVRVLLTIVLHELILLHFAELSYQLGVPNLEGTALSELKKAFNDPKNETNDWDMGLVSPCFSWSHVTCGEGHVITLNLASAGLSGTLSPSITKLKFLASLDLQNNNLSGELPDYIGEMGSLQYLNLANNNFTGSLPISWGHLSNLKHLILSNNKLGGMIPESITNISELKEIDLSDNDFEGKIPPKLFEIDLYDFAGTHLECNTHLQKACTPSSSIAGKSGKAKLGVVMGAIGGSLLVLASVAAFMFCCYRFHRTKHDIFVDVSGEDDIKLAFGQLRRFSWREMEIATNNFDPNNVIGQGGFGKVYRGVLADNTKVAVKRLIDYYNPGGEAAFLREVEFISVAVHKNLLRLIGWCTTTSERILVYPFMENLSVAYRLRELKPGEKGLDWPARKRVAFGAAHGLEYLHEHCNPRIIHRDMKAANILLDENFEAVVGDFGLAKVIDTKMTHVTTQIRGTMGHIAPEYLSTGKSTEKTDVFGYGITLLELVTGQRAIDLSRLEEEEDILLIDHIKKLLREKRLHDIVDNNLMGNYAHQEVEVMVQVALLCTQISPEERPKMAQVVTMLQGVGLTERWAEWEQGEDLRNEGCHTFTPFFAWPADSTHNNDAIQLSEAR